MEVVYKIMTPDEWLETCKAGEFLGSAVDRKDGFVHFSTSDQVEQTLLLHFAGSSALRLVAVSVQRLGKNLRFEPSRGGKLFPHLYGRLKTDDILWSEKFEASKPDELRKLISE